MYHDAGLRSAEKHKDAKFKSFRLVLASLRFAENDRTKLGRSVGVRLVLRHIFWTVIVTIGLSPAVRL